MSDEIAYYTYICDVGACNNAELAIDYIIRICIILYRHVTT